MAGLLMSFTTDHNLQWWGSSFMTERQQAWDEAITVLNISLQHMLLRSSRTEGLKHCLFALPFIFRAIHN